MSGPVGGGDSSMSDPCSPPSPHPAQIHPSYHPHSYTGKSAYVASPQHQPPPPLPPPPPSHQQQSQLGGGLHQQVGPVPLANNNHHLHPPQQPVLPHGTTGKHPVKYDPSTYPTVMLPGATGSQQQQPKAPKSAPRQNSHALGYASNPKATKTSQQDGASIQSKRPRKGSGTVPTTATTSNKNIDNVSLTIFCSYF